MESTFKISDLIKKIGDYPTGNICNAHSQVRTMHNRISSLMPGMKIAGPAKTAAITPGQNAAIHRAVHNARPGDILVVDGRKSVSFGPFGDILALCCQHKGVLGLVIDSTVRDYEEILNLKFPVFCLGTNPAATEKTDQGKIDIPIVCGDVSVNPDDIIVADDDGVVVIPRKIAAEVAVAAIEYDNLETWIKNRLEKENLSPGKYYPPDKKTYETYRKSLNS